QSQSWWRVFNDSTDDQLHPYFTMNLAAIFTNEDAGWNIMAYIKNVTDETAITGAFLNSDDTGLTTNVFLTEPRLYGLRVTKNWSGGSTPWLSPHGGPNPFTVEIGGQVQRHDAPNEAGLPGFAGAFTGPLDVFASAQDAKLDWGQGGEARLTYQPSGSPWSLSAGVRFGKTNGQNHPQVKQENERVCGFAGYLASYCQIFANDPTYGPLTYLSQPNFSEAIIYDRESHEAADFSVGRDVGFGGLGQSRLSLGLEYVHLDSKTLAEFRGTPDWVIPAGYIYPGGMTTHTTYDAHLAVRRNFKGFGPMLSWEAALPVWRADAGHLDLDWSATGGALFGTQHFRSRETEFAYFYSLTGLQALGQIDWRGIPTSTTVPPPVEFERSKSVTVPTFAATLGFSYTVGGFKAGAGYRWERYFNAIDGGYAEHRSEDRTIDGPYFKIAVGFGG
ncbi:MAG: Lpg1974 family pore-forming outer membrane protein, partial [Ignavibacteriales bacterium]